MVESIEHVRVERDGVGLEVRVAGPADGRPVVLLHGYPDTSAIWDDQIVALATTGYRVAAPDARGSGQSDRPAGTEAYSMGELVADVVAVCASLGLDRPAVVGHDLGAATAWVIGSRLAEHVSAVVALSVGYPAGFAGSDLDQLQRWWYLLLFQFPAAESYLRDDDWRGLRQLAADHPRLDEVIERFEDPAALTASLGPYRANIGPDLFTTFDAGAPRVTVPAMGLWSEEDRILGEAQMTLSADFVDAPWRYEKVGGGHWFQVDAADRVNALLLDFLGGL